MRFTNTGFGFTLWLDQWDTADWAAGRGPSGGRWPCSELAGRRLRAEFDNNGLLDYAVDGVDGSSLGDRGIEIPLDEFSAIVADFAQLRLAPDHPAYFVAVGQFAQSREEA